MMLTFSTEILGQCPQVNGESITSPGLTPSATPKWYQCANLQNPFNLNVTTPTAWTGPVTVNWGDGTANTTVPTFAPGSPILHSFAPLAAGLTDGDSLFITISNGTCTVTGILYRELPVNALIGIPSGDNTFCAPANLVFTNQSSNVSETTTFIWNFGDNTPPLNFDDQTQPPTVPHTFNSTLTCTPSITLTASNYCRRKISGGASVSTTTAITIINKDIPIISATAGANSSATRFCYPDTAITFTNNSTQNCPGANSGARTERWIFNRGSLGTTTVGPTTWPPAVPQVVTFPGLGSYQVTLEATNECGMADTMVTVQIVTPPTVTISTTTNSALDGVICQGEAVTFTATRTGNPDVRKWNFPGTGWFSLNASSTPFTFNTAGTFQVGTMVGFGNGSASCTDTAFFTITVLPSPAVTIVADDDTGCDSQTVLLTANSPTATAWNWNFGTGMGTSTAEGPHTKTYVDGTNVLTTYTVSLTVQNAQGCSGTDTQTINVYNSPIPSFTVQNLCEGQTAQFTDATPPRPADNLTSWNWTFGDGTPNSNIQNPSHFYNSTGTFPVTLNVTSVNCSGSVTQNISVEEAPVAVMTSNVIQGCAPLTVAFGNSSEPAFDYEWTFGDGTSQTTTTLNNSPEHTYFNATDQSVTYTAVLSAQNQFGCGSTDTLLITALPAANADFVIPNNTGGCSPYVSSFTNLSTNASTYNWNFGDNTSPSTQVNPTHTYINSGGFLQNFDVRLIAASPNGCNDTTLQSVPVFPLANFNFVLPQQTGCSPVTVQMPAISGVQSYTWNFGDGSPVDINPAPIHTFENTTGGEETYTVTFIGISPFGCRDTSTATIDVLSQPVADFAPDTVAGCSPLTTILRNFSEFADTYLWEYGDGSTSATEEFIHDHLFTNNTGAPITRTVTLTASNASGCVSELSLDIDVFPAVQAVIEDPGDFCSPATFELQSESVNASNFTWNLDTGLPEVTGSDPLVTYINPTSSNQNFDIRLISSSVFGCRDTAFQQITIFPEVTSNFTPNIVSGCGPLSVSFANAATNANQFSWNYGDGGTSNTTASSHNHTFENFGATPITRQVTLTAQSTQGCSDVATQTIVINPNVQAGFVNATGLCAPAQVAFQNTSNNANTFNWQLGNGSNPSITAPVSTFNNSSAADTTFNVRLIASSSFGCADTVFGTVLVHPEVMAQLSTDIISGCAPLQVALNNASVNASDVTWDYGDGATSSTEESTHNHTFENPGGGTFTRNVLMRVTSAAGCEDEASVQIQIFPQVIANFPQPSPQCSPSNVTFVNSSTNANTFDWDFGNGNTSIANSPSELFIHEGSQDTLVVIQLIASSINGCADTLQRNLTIKKSPLLDFTLSENEGCAPLQLTIQNNSENIDVISWDYGDGENSATFLQEHTHEFDNPTGQTITRQITLSANTFGGCSAQISLPLQVFPDVITAFSDPEEFCSPASFALLNGTINASNFQWDFGNGETSSIESPIVNFINPGIDDTTFVIQLVATSSLGCTDSILHDVVINPAATAAFEINFSDSCSPVVVSIDNQSFNADNLTWEYGDGSTDNVSSDHTHEYNNQGTDIDAYELRLTVSNVEGCGSTVSKFFSVYPVVEAVFSELPPACSPYAAQFISSSVNADEFSWDYAGQGTSNEEVGQFEFLNETNETAFFTVRLAVNSDFGCNDTTTREIAVLPSPQAQFSLDVNTGCAPFTVNLTNSSSANADAFSWNYGDGDSSSVSLGNHAHEFNNIGETIVVNNVTLTAFTNEGCSRSMVLPVEVKPVVQAAFNDLDPQCAPVAVTFVNSTIPATGITYEWDLGIASGVTDEEPTQFYTNTSGNSDEYNIRLIASSTFGCRDTAENILVINSRPVAQFTADTLTICTPFEVNFTNTSIAADSVRWFYGDGAVSSVIDDVHAHEYFNGSSSPINYNILLTAFDSSGCSSEASAVVQALPDLNVSFVDPFDGCTPLAVNLFNTTQNGGEYSWDFGNGASNQTSVNAATEYVNESDSNQVYTIRLTGVSPFGCQEEVEQQVVVFPGPRAHFDMSSSEACHPAPISFFNETINGETFFWDYGDGEDSETSDISHIHTFGAPVTGSTDYIVRLMVTSANGCVDEFDSTFTLYPVLIADFFADSIGCSPFSSGFQNESFGASAYQWVFGDGESSTSVNPVHNYDTPIGVDTVYTATLTAFNEFGCESVQVKEIEVRSTPDAEVNITNVTGCFPRTVTFENTSVAANSYIWTYGTGEISNTNEPVHSHDFVNVTDDIYTYQILLEAVSIFGCIDTATASVEVPQEINALFTSIPGGCTPLEITFDNNSEGGVNYDWSFGDGSDTTGVFQPTHTFINPNTSDTSYTVQLIVSDDFGCADTMDMEIGVYTDPIAGFDVTPEIQTWPNATVNMTNNTIGGPLNAQWNMNTGDFLFEFNPPSYTYTTWGEYTIQLVVANGSCQDTAYRDLVILPPPAVANFVGDSIGCAPLTVKFTNLSEYIVESRWDFGDGGESQVTDPIYTYYEPGTYSVKLSILGPDSAVVDTLRQDIVVVIPTARASFSVFPSVVNVPVEPVNFVSISENATEFSWDFGDGGTSVEENPEYTYTEVGDYDVTLIVNNENNCPDTLTRSAVIEARASGVLEFPTAFTPNQQFASGGPYDAQSLNNDVFFPRYSGVDSYELRIFNKWGEMIFYTNDIKMGWDGYYKGSIVEQGVYVWNAKGVFLDGRTYEDTGDITLIIR
jgi:PKD repeat protein